MEYTEDDLREFVENVWITSLGNNAGGMSSADMFSLWYVARKLNPSVIVESGVWRGFSTFILRKACPTSKLICLDVEDLLTPDRSRVFYKDRVAEYYIGKDFIDFKDLDLDKYNPDDVLCFFDDHINQCERINQCRKKGITRIFFNDNYPKNCGSHLTLCHMKENDMRNIKTTSHDDITSALSSIKYEYIFPNVYPGMIKTGEGEFSADSFYDSINEKFMVFLNDRPRYRWNTYIELEK